MTDHKSQKEWIDAIRSCGQSLIDNAESIAGDFDFDKVLDFVVEKFDFEGRKNGERRVNKIDLPTNETKYVEEKSNITTGFLTVGYLCPEAKDLKGTIIGDIIAVVTGEGQSSRLYQNLI